MAEPSEAQLKALRALAEQRYHDGWMMSPPATPATLRALRRRGWIEGSHDGGRFAAHRITAEGRNIVGENRP
jgi:DNA-binding PadR family transcriptional regulator